MLKSRRSRRTDTTRPLPDQGPRPRRIRGLSMPSGSRFETNCRESTSVKFSKVQSGKMSPAPGRCELSKGMLKWTYTMFLGFETLKLKCCELKLWELTVTLALFERLARRDRKGLHKITAAACADAKRPFQFPHKDPGSRRARPDRIYEGCNP